jgi:signal transduction histidine kinase
MHSLAHPPLLARLRPGHWQALDRLAAAGYVAAAFALLLKYAHSGSAVLGAAAGAAALGWPLAWRRRHPAGALALTLAGTAAVAAAQPRAAAAGLVVLAFVLYTVAATSRIRAALGALAVAIAAAGATALPDFRAMGAAAAFALAYVTVWTIGFAVGQHRRYTADLLAGQARLAGAELSEARRGVTEQRLRMARELHDVLAHQMSVITVQAGYGGLVIDENPAQARAALAIIENAGRETLAEMRRLLGVLRADAPAVAGGAPAASDGTAAGGGGVTAGGGVTGGTGEAAALAPAPGLASLDRLAEQIALAGVRVDLFVTGRPRRLPAGLDLSAYRIVQEALTNVVRHAATAEARARVDYLDDRLLIEVTDDSPSRIGQDPDGGRPAGTGPRPEGHGLGGMRERASLFGGELSAGPRPGGGFKVTATLPLPARRPR